MADPTNQDIDLDLDLVAQQTGATDMDLVRKAYDDAHGDVVSAICALLSVPTRAQPAEVPFEEKSDVEKFRQVMTEKEEMFYAQFKRMQQQQKSDDTL